jgi:IS5 family transposase
VQGEQALRECVGIDLSRESVPDATTVLKFRRLLLDNDLTKALFKEINAHLAEQGCYQLKLTHLT